MKGFKLILLSIVVGLFTSCKTGSKLIVLEEKAEVDLKINSACRSSTILPFENEAGIKMKAMACSDASIKKMKIKKGKSIEKSTYRIKEIKLVVTEMCQGKSDNNPPAIKLNQKLILEHLETRQIIDFETDTLINNQRISPTQVVKKVDFQDYIQPLTDLNYKKASVFFKNKK